MVTVRTLDGSEAAGALLVLDVVRHAETAPEGPWTANLGLAAVIDGAGAVWFVGEGDVCRLAALPCECDHIEYTTFKDGAEVSRTVVSTR